MALGDIGTAAESVDIAEEAMARLTHHLENWLGAAPGRGVVVVTSAYREQPGWDGQLRPFVGVSTPSATVISVADELLAEVAAAVDAGGVAELEQRIGAIVGNDDATLRRGVFRFQQRQYPYAARGDWVDPADPGLPSWLRPFNGEVLVARVGGRHAAGVGRKRHDPFAQEIAVTTDERFRRRGYARDLVAQAAARVFAEGCVATYLHHPDNLGSAAVAEATGFHDAGWTIISVSVPRA